MFVFFVHTCLYFDTVHLFPKPKCLYLKINFEILIYTDTFLAFKFKIILVRIYPTEIQFFLLIIIQFISCNSILILFLYCSWRKLYFHLNMIETFWMYKPKWYFNLTISFILKKSQPLILKSNILNLCFHICTSLKWLETKL